MFKNRRFLAIMTICLVFFFSFQFSATYAESSRSKSNAYTESSRSNSSVNDLAAAKAALNKTSVLQPVEGVNSNVIKMAQDIADEFSDGVIVTINRSNNRQISSKGTITYGESTSKGSVTFKLTKGRNSSTQSLTVIVPPSLEASALQAAKRELANKSPLLPIEGKDINVASMAQDIVDQVAPGVMVAVSKSSNKQVAKNGEIIYQGKSVKGNVTFVLRIGKRSDTQSVSVIVPSKGAIIPDEPAPSSETDMDAASVTAAQAKLAAAGTLTPAENTDTNLIDLAKSIIDAVSSGVTVEITHSNNPGVSSKGAITYVNTPTNGEVIFKLSKNSAVATQTVPVVVPAKSVQTMVNVKDFGAKGDSYTDDTRAVQKAIDYAYSKGLRIVYVPDGIYRINPDISVRLKSNVRLQLSDNAVLKSLASDEGYYNIVLVLEVSNVEIAGGKIIGDRDIHKGTSGEWGAGIGILGSSTVSVSDMVIQDCWGDGIFIGDAWDSSPNYCENITIDRVVCDNNRRQGISVISVKGLMVRDCILRNTNGTAPMSGIDLEPNTIDQYMLDVVLKNIQSYNNGNAGAQRGGYGLDIWLGGCGSTFPYGLPKENVSIKVDNFVAYGNYRGDTSPNWDDYKTYGYAISGSVI